MTVKELIKELETMPSNFEVMIPLPYCTWSYPIYNNINYLEKNDEKKQIVICH